jgi:cob(I)alamin adenosyltransferase
VVDGVGTSGILNSLKRFPKNHPVYEALGTIDELSSFLGHAKSAPGSNEIFGKNEIATIQQTLQDINAQIARDPNSKSKREEFNINDQIAEFEKWIDSRWKQMPPLTKFILPEGGELTTRSAIVIFYS